MTTVYTENVDCPVCAAHIDVTTRTNEREIVCRRCGYVHETKVVAHQGIDFWVTTTEVPISKTGDGMATPETGKWNATDYRTLPSFTEIPAEFSVEEAK